MDTLREKRITYKSVRPNPLFQEWLEELYSEAKSKKSKLEGMLAEALSSISKYPLPLESGAECAILKGFDKRLCIFLDKQLEVYNSYLESTQSSDIASSTQSDGESSSSSQVQEGSNNDNVLVTPSTSQTAQPKQNENSQLSSQSKSKISQQTNPNSQTSNSSQTNKSRKRVTKSYKPSYRSGGYALLVALFEFTQKHSTNSFISKEELIERAQKHSDESFVCPKPDTHYTAWSNMTRLITKGFVNKIRKKKVEFSLTDTGKQLALEVLSGNGEKRTVNDTIFNITPSDNVNSETQHTDNRFSVTDVQMVEIPQSKNVEVETETLTSQKSLSQSSRVGDLVELAAGSFDVILLVDKNETGGLTKKNEPMVAQIDKYPDMLHEYRSLKVGDFTWIARHKTDKAKEIVLPYIIERKRMDDLGGSIKDGRFHEQKFRLRKCKLENVIYLVENYGSNKNVGLPLQTLMQALANTRVVDGFRVHVTDSLTCTVRFLAIMTKRLTIEYKNKNLKGCNQDPQDGLLMTFNYFNKSSAKNRPLSITDTFIKLLLQLKGVSIEKALAITSIYPTPTALFKAYNETSSPKEGELLLANLRAIGPKISKSVYHLFTKSGI